MNPSKKKYWHLNDFWMQNNIARKLTVVIWVWHASRKEMLHYETHYKTLSLKKKKSPKCFYSLTSRFSVVFSTTLETLGLNKDTLISNPAYNYEIWCLLSLPNVDPLFNVQSSSSCINLYSTLDQRINHVFNVWLKSEPIFCSFSLSINDCQFWCPTTNLLQDFG